MPCVWNSSTTGTYSSPRMENFVGVTDGSGVFSQSYSSSFQNPQVFVSLIGADTETIQVIVTSDVNGFTLNAKKRSSLTVLTLQVLSFGTTNAPGVLVNVLVMEKQSA